MDEFGSMQSERIAVSKLLHLAAAMAKTGFISQVSKCFFKDMIVEKNEEVIAIAEKLNKDLAVEEIIQILNALIANRVKSVFEFLYADCSLEQAHLLASEDQRSMVKDDDVKSLVYGEVEFDSFYEVLQQASIGLGDDVKFYDLGSGTGKAIFVAILVLDLKFAGGIEILKRVHDKSHEILDRYTKAILPKLNYPALVKFYHGSFLEPEFDWTDGDLIFANSTCFEEDLIEKIAKKAEGLRPGARVITFTMALKSLWFKIIYKKRFTMSWGPATVYIHQKLSQQQYSERLNEPTEYDDDQGISHAPSMRRDEADSLYVNPSETHSVDSGSALNILSENGSDGVVGEEEVNGIERG